MKKEIGIMFLVIGIILVVVGLTYAWCEWNSLKETLNIINNVI